MNFLIDFEQTTTQLDIDTYFIENQCTLIKNYSKFDNVYLVASDIIPPITSIVTSVINDSDSAISLLSTVNLFESSTTTNIDVADEKNWWKAASIYEIDFSQPSYTHKIYGENTTVYIVDSGIDISHTEFVNKNIQLFWSSTGDFTDNNGHGTALASLIVGNTCGLTNTAVKVIKVLDNSGPTLLSHLVEAFDKIMLDFNSQKFAIVNLSWSIPKNDYINSKIQQMLSLGIAVVASAGNNGSPIIDVTPAGIEGVITIGSYDQNFYPCNFSNYTSSDLSLTNNIVNVGALDGWAPGERLYVALPGNNYGFVAGTSFSAAIHSGALAYDVDLHHCIRNGNLPDTVAETRSLLYDSGCLARKNILTLTGNYSSSVNKITTYAGSLEVPYLNVFSFPPHVRCIAGLPMGSQMVSPATVQSVTITPDLPVGLELHDNGYIIGQVNLDQSAPDISVTYHNFSIVTRTGQTIDHNLEFVVVKNNNFSELNIPEEYVWVTLQGTLCNDQTCGLLCPAANNNNPSRVCVVESKANPICPICAF